MPYSVAQFKRSQKSSYLTPLTYTEQYVINDDALVEFLDPALILSGSNILNSVYSYYIRFSITQRTDSVQKVDVILKNTSESTDNIQEIRTITVKEGTDSSSFEMIFNPISTFNQLIFQLSRTADDFWTRHDDGTSGRIMEVEIEEFAIVDNVLDTISSIYSDVGTLAKIGIEGPPGMMFCIDGEEMRIGRTGIYELYNDNIEISYIGFVVKDSLMTQDGQDFFTLNFKY